MHFTNSLLFALLALWSLVRAANTGVSVGAFANGTSALTFDPSSITAAIGDTITFTFYPKNHSVTQSTFANPCTLMPPNATSGAGAGIDSGFMPVVANATTHPTVTVNVTVATPIWFFCAQTGHCGMGMVFAVNAPPTGNTFEAYLSKALATGTGLGTGTGSSTGTGSTVSGPGINSNATGTGTTGTAAVSLPLGSGLISVGGLVLALILLA